MAIAILSRYSVEGNENEVERIEISEDGFKYLTTPEDNVDEFYEWKLWGGRTELLRANKF